MMSNLDGIKNDYDTRFAEGNPANLAIINNDIVALIESVDCGILPDRFHVSFALDKRFYSAVILCIDNGVLPTYRGVERFMELDLISPVDDIMIRHIKRLLSKS